MKHFKKMTGILLALVMVLSMTVTAFAAAESYTIKVKNTNTSVSMEGNTYRAYKLFNVTYSDVTETSGNYAYTVTEEFKDFEYSYYTVNEDGGQVLISVSGENLIAYLEGLEDDAEALDAFAKAALSYATEKNIAAAGSVTAGEGAAEAVISVDSAGYYLVAGSATAPDRQTVVAACALTTTDPTAEVTVKADVPSIEKKIVQDDTLVKANTASIGDSVTFRLSSSVPQMKGYEKYFFVMNDTLSDGLTYNGDDSMTVKIGGTTLTKGTDYTVETSGQNITIVFKNFIQYKAQAGSDVAVTYSATLNEKASLSAADGNVNTVTLTYSNNPNTQGTGMPENPDKPASGDATGTTPQSQTKTYVTGIKINKVDGKDVNKSLAGAKFSISGTAQKVVLTDSEMFKASESGTYYMLKDGTYTETAAVTDKKDDGYNADRYDSTTQKYEKVTVVTKDTVAEDINAVGYTDAQGVLTFAGLNAGTYTITELVAPSGYNLLKNPVTITITADADMENANWTVSEKIGDGEAEELTAGADNLFSFNVINNSGAQLPETGGMGTTLIYVLGGILVLLAGILLITRKRMSREEK